MPRLSAKDYIKYRKFLRRLWLQRQAAYSYLTPAQQWQIHAFFRPDEELTTEQLLEHRTTITAEQPSLPHQAGRAIKDFGQLLRQKAKVHATVTATAAKKGKATRNIRVRSVVRPQIDVPRLARTLIALETENARRDPLPGARD